MQIPTNNSQQAGFTVQDVLFMLLKHKWKIITLSLLGFGGAMMVYIIQGTVYKSESKLLVRYVLEKGTVDPYVSMQSLGSGGKAGDSVINTEIEILKSQDLALEVADAVGVSRLLPEPGVLASRSDAAGLIITKLDVTTGQSSNVLYVNYSNKDPQLAKDVLARLVDRYFKKHLEIHRSAAAFDVVANQMEEARVHLQQTDERLNQLRTETGIMTLEDATGALSSQRTKTQEDLLGARAELAEKVAALKEIDKGPEEYGLGTLTNGKGGAALSAAALGNRVVDESRVPPPEVVSEYRAVMELLSFLQKRDLELRLKFKPGNRLLVLNQEQLQTNDARRRDLEQDYSGLIAEAAKLSPDTQDPHTKLIMGKAGLSATHAKIAVLNANLKEIGEQFSRAYMVGVKIEELRRQRDIEDSEYRVLETNLKNARIDQTLDPSRMPNITIVQQPSEPLKTFDATTKKITMGLAGGGMGAGIALALVIELVFNGRINRPIEIQTRLQLPLLLSIPYIRTKDRGELLLAQESAQPRIGMHDNGAQLRVDPQSVISGTHPLKTSHYILPYTETIRDRMIFNFEINNVTHKPKLVAVTGLSEGAGASTIAAGLAKSFAEIRGMKVLLVDLSAFPQEGNPLFGEIPMHSLNVALNMARQTQFRSDPQNLYLASANARRSDNGLNTFSSLNLHELLPHLQESEYDYIIFDMPTLDQTSRTLTMAGMMDKVLLVLDAENTSRDGLKWGYGELIKGKADVSCVFNKNRTHAPGWLIGKS
jgi:succinoglycan biosynthesis transport protein ExoP